VARWTRLPSYAASEQELLERLQALRESVGPVMLIGHNPGLHSLALVLPSRGADLPQLEEKFQTGALAMLVVRGRKLDRSRPPARQSSSITLFPGSWA
jgi:phosphohistidine phosphatase SixA